MQVKAHIDKIYEEVEVHVCNYEMNQTVSNLVNNLDHFLNDSIMGTDGRGNKCVLAMGRMIRFYSEGAKVMAQDENGIYSIQRKLYELEKSLGENNFIRISKSEIVNLSKIKRLDMSITGTIKVILTGNIETYTSRRNVSKLKKALGL